MTIPKTKDTRAKSGGTLDSMQHKKRGKVWGRTYHVSQKGPEPTRERQKNDCFPLRASPSSKLPAGVCHPVYFVGN